MAEVDLLGLLQGRVAMAGSGERCPPKVDGVTLGVVSEICDPSRLGRVKLRFPWLSDEVESAWARVATAWAGPGRGAQLLPEIGDEVLAAFQHGDVRFPFVLGFLWNQNALPPAVKDLPKQRRSRLRSRTGHTVTLDDTPAAGSLSLRSAAGHEVALDDASHRITISASGAKPVTVVLDGQTGTVEITAGQNASLDLQAPSGFVGISGRDVAITASGELQLVGNRVVRINC